jgi:sigma-B regulation protein RsbU (phosphoserine phosphatase)
MTTVTPTMFLVPLSGPPLEAIALNPKPGGIVIGRHEDCDLPLPAEAEKVSRFHARFNHDGSRWFIADMDSRWGTLVNGVKLSPQSDVPLCEGDLIRIAPWTLAFSSHPKRRGLQTSDDSGQTLVRTVTSDSRAPLAEAILSILIDSAEKIHAAADEKQLADAILDAAVRGTSLQNGAMLRPIDSAGNVEIISSHFAPQTQTGGISFSRSLINAASSGNVAELNAGGEDISQSIVQLKINSALCIPLMLGNSVAAYLYLDSRGTIASTLRSGASSFCVALGRMASLALANLKRLEMEKRDVMMRGELAAAAAAQKWIMPKREGSFGSFKTIGESKPGQYVGGDFFDIIPLDQNRLAVALGDVSGKGVAASVLMTATQGFLHASLIAGGDLATAINNVNRFVCPRRPEGKFVTMWVGIFDAKNRTLSYVDAGHSYALLKKIDGGFQQLDLGGGLPIGVEESIPYSVETVTIAPGEKVLIVSDGIIEQFGLSQRGDETAREQFGTEGTRTAMAQAKNDAVAELFAAVVNHAGTEHLSDDATAVLVEWSKGIG